MKTKAALAVEAAQPLVIEELDLDGPKEGKSWLKLRRQVFAIQMHSLYLEMIQKVFFQQS